jgi:hypothetical protein
MSKKIYKTAMGKPIDLSSLILQNENVRAVGNMSVNARGDLVDSANRVIDKKNSQVQRQYSRQTQSNVKDQPLHTGTKQARAAQAAVMPEVVESVLPDLATAEPPVEISIGGLAGALNKVNKSA